MIKMRLFESAPLFIAENPNAHCSTHPGLVAGSFMHPGFHPVFALKLRKFRRFSLSYTFKILKQ